MENIAKMTAADYLKNSTHPAVRSQLLRMERGDFNYTEAIEQIAVLLLQELEAANGRWLDHFNAVQVTRHE